MSKMCTKANMVRRFYILMITHPMKLESRCIGVMKRAPTETEINELQKKYTTDPVIPIELQKLYTLPVDIPVSILF